MKKIITVILIIFILPPTVIADESTCYLNDGNTGCESYLGCKLSTGFTSVATCTPCDKGTYNDGETLNTLQENYTRTQCKPCTNGPNQDSYTKQGWVTSDCPWELTCPAGQYFDTYTKSCTNCPDNTYSGGKISTIFDGENTSGNTQCQPCPEHSEANESNTGCDCDTGYEEYNGTCTPKTIKCDARTYLPKNKTTCSNCPSEYYCPGNTKQGYQFNEQDDQGLTVCPKGSYCPAKSSSPSPCPAGSTSDDGKESITDCYMNSDTKFCDVNGKCVSFGTIFGETTTIKYDLN